MKKNTIFFTFIVLTLIIFTRLPLFTGYSQYFFGDEIRYNRLIVTLKQSEKLNDSLLYLQGMFAIHARPGYAFLYTPTIWLEKQNRENPDFIQNSKNDFPYGVMFNIIFNFIMILLIYLIVQEVINKRIAFLSTLLIIFSITSILYMRHMLPYDASLLFLLLGFYLYIKTYSLFAFGLLTGFSFLVYPSYTYYLIPIPFILLFFAKEPKVKFELFVVKWVGKFGVRLWKKKLHAAETLLFIVGFTVVLLFTEIISRIVSADSYFLTLKQLGLSVAELKQGDFTSALLFISEYIISSDGYWGLVLAFFTTFMFWVYRKKNLLPLLIYLALIIVLFELFSDITHSSVLYGRTVRPFYFLTLVTSAIVFDAFFQKISSRLHIPIYFLHVLVFTITFLNWWPRFNTYKNLVYPGDVRFEAEEYLKAKYDKYTLEDVYTKKRFLGDNATDPPKLESGKFYLTNPALVYPYFGNLSAPCDKEVFFEKKHALIFVAYHFEGFTKEMRQYLVKDPPKYQLIRCK